MNTTRISSGLRRVGLMATLALVVSACADDKPLNTFEPAGPKAQELYDLMITDAPFIAAITVIIFVLVIFGTIAIAVKGRVKEEDFDEDDLPEQIHGNTKLELGWTIAPAILLAVVSIPTVATIWSLEERNETDELDVMVIGQQWWWEYRYDIDGDGFFEDADGDGEQFGPNGEGGDLDDVEWPLNIALDDDDLVVANQLVIPAGQQIDLYLTSRDVIHSYWLPRLNGKRDTVPGRIHTWSIEADEPGEYNGWCTEYCGLSHARMRMSAVALPQAEFDAWLENQIAGAQAPAEDENSPEWRGYQIFQAQCMSCHVVDDGELAYGQNFEAALTAGAAPNLSKFATRSVFAGAIYSQYAGIDADDDDLFEQIEAMGGDNYLDLSEVGRFNEAELKRWISNAPDQKAMAPEDLRGMPAFPQLTDENLDDLVAYLHSLD